jgi:hypothetical protein
LSGIYPQQSSSNSIAYPNAESSMPSLLGTSFTKHHGGASL